MKNKFILLGVIVVASLMLTSAVFAMPKSISSYDKPRGNVKGITGKSKTAHLYLVSKVPQDPWPINPDGGWGKMTYKTNGPEFKFVFNGHDLTPETEYTLIYYPDPWPGSGLICLGSDTADEDGNVRIKGSTNTGDLPTTTGDNYPTGAKIWLVLSSDVQCTSTTQMVGWTPTSYLFEYQLITFDDTDV